MSKFAPSKHKQNYTITIFLDSEKSWFLPWAERLKETIEVFHNVDLCTEKENIKQGDINFILSCTTILEQNYLLRNNLNLVVHESDLPEGRGWSPLAWQILEGKNTIPIVLFEAEASLDSGPIYLRDKIELKGTELLPEIKKKQAEKTLQIIIEFLETWPDIEPQPQIGISSFFKKRTRNDDQLDENKTLAENFNHLRITDNEKYPAWFQYKGQEYILKIYPK